MNHPLRPLLGAIAAAALTTACVPTTMNIDKAHPADPKAATTELPAADETLEDGFDPSVAYPDPRPKGGGHHMHHGHHDHAAMKKKEKKKEKPDDERDEHAGHHHGDDK